MWSVRLSSFSCWKLLLGKLSIFLAAPDKGDVDDETGFTQQLSEVSRIVRETFDPEDLVNHYVLGLKDAVHDRVQTQLQTILDNQRTIIARVKQLSATKVRAQNAQRLEYRV